MTRKSARTVRARGVQMPAIGFGTWQLKGSECADAVERALAMGYRHIDTAEAYENEQDVGVGLRRSGVDRKDVWITTKIWWSNLGYGDSLLHAQRSLERLGVDYVDLLLIHWPDEPAAVNEALSAMMEFKRRRTALNIGVSNFTPSLLERALKRAPLLVNQIEYHPFLAQDALLDQAEEHDILLTAYSPLARGRVAENETLRRIGRSYGKSAAQVALRWLVQQPRVAAIPKSADPRHCEENLDVFDFQLSDQEMREISGLDQGLRLVDPDFAPSWENAS